jgi:SAM-dependent methyltransferase
MRRDVLRKLRIEPGVSVVEIGCGIALVGLPVARRATRYLGLDFAPQAVQVANERFRKAGLEGRASAQHVDVLALGADELRQLGRFSRVLMYAVLHYARTDQEALRFLSVAADLLDRGGRALIGSLPLADLRDDWPSPGEGQKRGLERVTAAARWTTSAGAASVPLTRRWKTRYMFESVLNKRARRADFVAPSLPANYTLPLTTAAIERWLAMLPNELVHHWELPAAGAPLAAARADLIVVRP